MISLVKLQSQFVFIRFSETIPLSPKSDSIDWPHMHHAQFTPEGHALIMVYNYDIYFRRTLRAPETYRVTTDAVPGIVYNGVPDWLYEGK